MGARGLAISTSYIFLCINGDSIAAAVCPICGKKGNENRIVGGVGVGVPMEYPWMVWLITRVGGEFPRMSNITVVN